MRKWNWGLLGAIVFCVIFWICVIRCFADNSVRISELKDENEKLSAQVQQAQTYIQQAQIKIIGNNAVILELEKQDKKEEPTEEKK